MEITLIIASIGVVGTIINSYLISNSKTSAASAKKINAEADVILNGIKNEVITDLQHQIDHLREEISLLKKQEYIHVKEKVRLEHIIQHLTEQNDELKKSLVLSRKEIFYLTDQIANMRIELNKFKTQKQNL